MRRTKKLTGSLGQGCGTAPSAVRARKAVFAFIDTDRDGEIGVSYRAARPVDVDYKKRRGTNNTGSLSLPLSLPSQLDEFLDALQKDRMVTTILVRQQHPPCNHVSSPISRAPHVIVKLHTSPACLVLSLCDR